MQLLAIAGGAGPDGASMLFCCGVFPILPLVIVLAGRAVVRNSVWSACVALLLTGLPYLVLREVVAGYQPSDDRDVVSDQEGGRQTVAFYAWLTVVAGASAVWTAGRRRKGGASAQLACPPASSRSGRPVRVQGR